MDKEEKVSSRGKAIIYIVARLEEKGYMASMDGIIKIAQGVLDEETSPFKDDEFFGCLLSLKSKSAKILGHSLVRNGYLSQIYRDGDYFLKTTPTGKLLSAKMEGKIRAKIKTCNKLKPTIVRIKEN